MLDGRPRRFVLSTADMDTTLSFYTELLGFELEFRDGDRWAALRSDGLCLALAGPGEGVDGAPFAVAHRTTDLDAALDEVRRAGYTVLEGPVAGAHEVRATCVAPDGARLLLYHPTSQTDNGGTPPA